jgi:hypothetical protein
MNLYSTDSLLGALNSLKRPKPWLLESFFPLVQTEESEEIHFDVEIGARRVAPFVAPTSQGKIQDRLGFQTATFQPAYVKPKTAVRPSAALKRAMGETLGGGQMTANQRKEAIIASILFDHADQITRRLNLMAAEALRTGRVTVKGVGYATKVVSFGRDASLTIALTGTDKWSDPASTPIDDIEAWIQMVHELEGASIYKVAMDPVAYKHFKRNKQVTEVLDIRRAAGAPSAELGGMDLASGAKFGGNFGSFEVWVYSDFYEDEDDGTTKPVLPNGTVLGISDEMKGVRAFGAILDEEAGIQALPMFPKSWINPDPSVRFIMTQSAPLTVPSRPNACFCATVI